MSEIIVQKFGGTSVGSVERIDAVAEIVKNAPIATRWTKRSIYQLMRYDPKEAAWFEALNQSHTGATKDNKEGIRALLQKRDPVFTGE